MWRGVALLTVSLLSNASCIDPVQDIGYCRGLRVEPDSSLIFANEGVWFPQYRSKTKGADEFSCHTLYNDLYSSQNQEPNLSVKEMSYYTMKGEIVMDPKTTLLDRTQQRGVYITDDFLPGQGMVTVYHIMISITPQIRLRYVCTNTTMSRKDFDLVYIETRRAVGALRDIKESFRILKGAGLRGNLVRIKQTNCSRPISPVGFDEPMFTYEN